jgi:hypothetical protein
MLDTYFIDSGFSVIVLEEIVPRPLQKNKTEEKEISLPS